jgi:NAD(P)-dependent dehydrogenase (short-subunit alcohol dehydrogenase family)
LSDALFDVSGQVAVVTGGSRGIGRMIAHGLVARGVRVYISARKAEAAEATAKELSEHGECIAVPADLSNEAGAAVLAAAVSSREQSVNLLVNNAGAAWGAPLESYPESGFDKVLDTNVKGVFFVTQKLLPLLKAAATKDKPARIVNIGSVDALLTPQQANFAYSASKAAVHWLTRHLAQTLVAESVTVNAIAPGLFRTRMTECLFSDTVSEASVATTIPAGRLGTEEDIVGTVVYLASRAGAYVNGAVIPVGGGIEALRA